jgi:hypothetical protein
LDAIISLRVVWTDVENRSILEDLWICGVTGVHLKSNCNCKAIAGAGMRYQVPQPSLERAGSGSGTQIVVVGGKEQSNGNGNNKATATATTRQKQILRLPRRMTTKKQEQPQVLRLRGLR